MAEVGKGYRGHGVGRAGLRAALVQQPPHERDNLMRCSIDGATSRNLLPGSGVSARIHAGKRPVISRTGQCSVDSPQEAVGTGCQSPLVAFR